MPLFRNLFWFPESKHEIEKIQEVKPYELLSFGGVSNEVLVQLYKTFVRPLFEYGSIALIHIPKQIQRIQKVQNLFIRTSLRIPSYLSTNLIHQAAGLEKIDERLGGKGFNRGLQHTMILAVVVERFKLNIPLS